MRWLKGVGLFVLLLGCTSCGYRVVNWQSQRFSTMAIETVGGSVPNQAMKLRLRDALIERCLAGSGLKPVDRDGSLTLKSQLINYSEQVIATDVDGRTRRLQFSMRVNFELVDVSGQSIWSLKNYNYSDQYSITTAQGSHRDEAIYVQDDAMRSIADLVITNISLAISELELEDE